MIIRFPRKPITIEIIDMALRVVVGMASGAEVRKWYLT